MTSIEKELKESVKTGKCLHQVTGKYTHIHFTENCQGCEGFGVYLEGDEVMCCGKYKRVTKISFSNDK